MILRAWITVKFLGIILEMIGLSWGSPKLNGFKEYVSPVFRQTKTMKIQPF